MASYSQRSFSFILHSTRSITHCAVDYSPKVYFFRENLIKLQQNISKTFFKYRSVQ